jgi:hypothetical protein
MPRIPRSILISALLGSLLAAAPSWAGNDAAPKGSAAKGKPIPGGFEAIGLPQYVPPPDYSEDLVITAEGKTVTMRRFVDHQKVRTEMSVEGQQVVMIEPGDADGTMYTLAAEQKKAMKSSRKGLEGMSKEGSKERPDEAKDAPPAGATAEDLGDETIDGVAVKKVRMTFPGQGDVLAWFDKTTGAPVRMEGTQDGKTGTVEWKNRKAEAQKPDLFVVPKAYEVIDMDAMLSQMGGMGMGGLAKQALGGMAHGMGQSLGASLGSSLGASLGGPLGAAAGQFIGGRVGAALGAKVGGAGH